ncbi:MAG: UDP-2,3-diacylglucosamine diphosphatase LpxI [Planctomycetota bacterium]|nr:UDP-2,3-diacylglucosamine diphosphatase LpxI [Planctomycetota bacterium]
MTTISTHLETFSPPREALAEPARVSRAFVPPATFRELKPAPVLSILPDPPPTSAPVGLIAGGGRLPVVVAQGLRAAGYRVHVLGLSRQWEPELLDLCDSFREVGVLKVGSWGKMLSKMGIHHAIMVGKVDKAKLMHDPLRILRNLPDCATIVGWYRHLRHDRRSHAVLRAIAEQLERNGVSLLDSTMPIAGELATPGVMTKRQPTPEQRADYEWGWSLLTQTLRLDIGQAIAVRERDVIAVEAVEGTDRMIQRAGQLCRARGWTLCKGARAGHDRRSDVPTIGIKTIENLHAAGGRCLALAAGDVIMIDREQVIDLADRLGIAIVGIPPGVV